MCANIQLRIPFWLEESFEGSSFEDELFMVKFINVCTLLKYEWAIVFQYAALGSSVLRPCNFTSM